MKPTTRLLYCRMCKLLSLLATLILLAGSLLAATEYKLTKQMPIGGEGGWDYLSIDPAARRLYVTHATKIVVIDLDNNSVVGEIADTPGVHGLAIAPELGRGFSSNGKENKMSVIDLKTLTTKTKVVTGENPDAVLYEPAHAEVYVFNGRGRSATVINAKSGEVTATIPLDGKPEFAAVDPRAARVFCNVEDKNEVIAIDTNRHAVVAKWPLAPGEAPTGMAIDLVHHRLFVACQKLLMMLDSTNGQAVATVPIGSGVDACAFDDATHLVFASCGEGNTMIAKVDENKLNVVQTLQTQRGARTMALDTITHRIYLATADFDPQIKDERGRPKIIDGTFRILVYGTN
jgi:YVTN family beta-propeller protein